jgi:hypothetical protein
MLEDREPRYDVLSDLEVEEQLELMAEGPKRELARWMSTIYESDFGVAWAHYPTDDLLGSEPISDPVGVAVDDYVLDESGRESLIALRDLADGWFYEKDRKLVFVTLEEWEKVKSGEREP